MRRNVEGSGPAINEIWSRHILAFSWSYWQKSRKYSGQDSRVRLKPGLPRYEAEAPSTTQLILETYKVRNLNKNWNKHKSTKFGKLQEFPSVFTDIRLQLHWLSVAFPSHLLRLDRYSFVSDNGLTTGKWDGRYGVRSFVLRISSLISVQSYINWRYDYLHLHNHTLTEDTIICISTIIH